MKERKKERKKRMRNMRKRKKYVRKMGHLHTSRVQAGAARLADRRPH
jgi:hypothetical protein